MVLNMGPQHPSTHGVLRIELHTDGEVVFEAIPHLGYLHRCFEKICEGLPYNQIVPYTDRLDYLASMNMNLGYVLAVEKLMNIEVGERVQRLRVVMAELNRIASHLVALGTFGLDIGATTPFLYCFRDREKILDLFEKACGARLLYNYIWIGGLARDVDENWINECIEFLDYFEPKIKEYNDLLSFNKIFIERTANIGVLPPEVAIAYGCTGPTLRASGVKWDLRKDEPYSGYEKYDFNICVGEGEKGTIGDCWDRYWVRVLEMVESVKIVRQALDNIPQEDISAKIPKNFNKMPVGDVYFRTETPRGEIGFYIMSDGTKTPYRIKVRSPAFCNLSVLPVLARDQLIADLVAIVGSIDIVLGEVDR
ncbi:MAG: NADH-quinone oxidoreductase subunit D [bacterium]|nr:NADH-quinone oxidoreductase subunit D [bacterium]